METFMDMFSRSEDEILLPALIEDPMGFDEDGDDLLTFSRRALCRVAFVAAETATRFEREGIPYDPMSWMAAPRRMFDGAAALDACLDREAFIRATVFHGLSMGLDAEPEDVDQFCTEDDEDHDYGLEGVLSVLGVPYDKERPCKALHLQGDGISLRAPPIMTWQSSELDEDWTDCRAPRSRIARDTLH